MYDVTEYKFLYTSFIWLSLTTVVATAYLVHKKWKEREELRNRFLNFINRDGNNFAYLDTLPPDFLESAIKPTKKTFYQRWQERFLILLVLGCFYRKTTNWFHRRRLISKIDLI